MSFCYSKFIKNEEREKEIEKTKKKKCILFASFCPQGARKREDNHGK